MPSEIRMPELGAEIEHADLVAWLVAVGDRVEAGDLIAEIETDKATVEFESPHSGTILELCVAAGAREVKVGELIARIDSADGDAADEPAKSGAEAPAAPAAETGGSTGPGDAAERQAKAGEAAQRDGAAATPAAEATQSSEPASSGTAAAARQAQSREADAPAQADLVDSAANDDALETGATSPGATALARRIADQSGLDLAGLSGSGAHGKIRRADVQAALGRTASPGEVGRGAAMPAAAQSHAAAGEAEAGVESDFRGERVPHSRMRRTIAARLSEAKREIPHFYLDMDVTIDAVLALRKRLASAAEPVAVSVNDIVIAAAARALREVPEVNASWSDDAMLMHESVDVAVAVATDGGLVTPIVRDADRKGLAEIGAEMRELAERARARKLGPDEYRGGSFSISNLGMFGVRRVYAIVNPPHACILGVGRGEPRPVVVDGELAVATQMTLTLSADHRVVDGATGARFLGAVARRLQDPLEIML